MNRQQASQKRVARGIPDFAALHPGYGPGLQAPSRYDYPAIAVSTSRTQYEVP